MRSHGLRRGAATQPLAINRHMTWRHHPLDPSTKSLFQRGDVQSLEQFALHRWCGNPRTIDTDRDERVAAEAPSPPNNSKLIAPASQQCGNRDQEQAGQRIPFARCASMVRDRGQCLPETVCWYHTSTHTRRPSCRFADSVESPFRSYATLNLAKGRRTESPWATRCGDGQTGTRSLSSPIVAWSARAFTGRGSRSQNGSRLPGTTIAFRWRRRARTGKLRHLAIRLKCGVGLSRKPRGLARGSLCSAQ
jgi:hypothetical protein